VTARKLRAAGIERLVDVRLAQEDVLRRCVGSFAEVLRRLSFGQDERTVDPHRERKSVGCEETYARDLSELAAIGGEVERLARHAAQILERKGLFARTVTLKVRYSNFETITRSETRDPATRSEQEVADRAAVLLGKTEAGARPVRLLGVSVHGLRTEPEAPKVEEDPLLLAPEN
jgi:DNA polymerase-4